MEKPNFDLIVGASIMTALIILIAGVLWLKDVNVSSSMAEYSVLFPNIGSLQLGDPVLVNGVRSGQVKKIKLNDPYVEVTLSLDKSVKVTDSSSVRVQNIGLMGERAIGIQLSQAGTIYPPNLKSDKQPHYIYGLFDSGIAEAMGMLGNVLTQAESLVVNVRSIVDSTVGDQRFIDQFHVMVNRIDRTTEAIEVLAVDHRPELEATINNLHSVSADVKKLIDRNTPNANKILDNGAVLTDKAIIVFARVESLTVALESITKRIEKGEGAAGMILNDEQFKQNIKTTVNQLNSLLKESRVTGLPVGIRLPWEGSRKLTDSLSH